LKAFKQELKFRDIIIPEFFLSSGTKWTGKEEILKYIEYDLQN
jgi:hypothetical protein